jgi:hypothetical protein
MIQQTHHYPERQWYFSNSQFSSGWQDTIGPMGYVALLTLLGITAYTIAFWRFATRDLPAPN